MFCSIFVTCVIASTAVLFVANYKHIWGQWNNYIMVKVKQLTTW